jgi:hypothetical protein
MQVPAELDARFRTAAAAEGLLDAAYDLVDSPLGTLLVAATDAGVCRIAYVPDVDEVARTVGPRVLRVPARLGEAREQLEQYFAGDRHVFDLALDLRAPEFQTAVLTELARVPYGAVATYGDLEARRATRTALLALPGIGPWTASYVAMRALGDPDVFLPTDLGVRHALERLGVASDPKAAQDRAERWRPWRSYALVHLWTHRGDGATVCA